MIKYVIGIVITFFIVVFGLTMYLQPNDLAKCSKSPSDKVGCSAVDAIVAVSGGDTQARANQAISLYQAGWSKTLVFSGAAMDKSGPSNAEVMKRMAVAAGVPESKILIDEDSSTTKQNAEDSNTIFSQNGISSVILVTSGYHQRRASLEFKKRAAGVTIVNAPVLVDQDWSFLWWTTIQGWWLAMSEIIKIIIFFATGM